MSRNHCTLCHINLLLNPCPCLLSLLITYPFSSPLSHVPVIDHNRDFVSTASVLWMKMTVQWQNTIDPQPCSGPAVMEGEATPPDGDTVTLVAEGRHFTCHKAKLMSGSDYFKAMFSNNFTENGKKLIELQVISSLLFTFCFLKCWTLCNFSLLAFQSKLPFVSHCLFTCMSYSKLHLIFSFR